MSFRWRLLAPSFLLLALLPAAAHEDLLGTHHVAPNGVDQGDCKHAHTPCLTLSYAATQADDGDLIKVAEGTYYLNDRELAEMFYSPVKLLGGYSTTDEFATQGADLHPTTLVASKQWQTAARARGFKFDSTGAGSNDQVGLSVAGTAAAANCVQGSAGTFPCRNVDLLSHIPLATFSSRPASASDLWGFIDRNDNREYAVVGLSNGTAFVDITDPANPREAAFVSGLSSLWREPIVYQYFDSVAGRYRAFAYVSTEARGGSVEIIDLSGLPNSVARVTQLNDMLSAHTVYISNVEYAGNTPNTSLPAYLVVAGSSANGGALRIYNLTNPASPALVSNPVNGYMHDSVSFIVSDSRTAQCTGGSNPCEIIADFNENTIDLWDVSNKAAPVRLSSTTYPSARYVHSGWPTSNTQHLIVFDELDELRISGQRTQIYTLDISSLTEPVVRTSYTGPTNSTDHNGYVKGDRLYVSHYRRGLVVFDASDPNSLKEVGNLDTFTNPAGDTAGTDGNWGAYPFFPSGNIAVSDIDNGLFILRDNTRNLQNRPGRIGYGVTSISTSESAFTISIPVRRVDGRQGALTVDYAATAGTATAGSDFQTANGTLTWADGDDADKLISIPLVNDAAVESAETLNVTLSNLSSAAQLDGAATVTAIINDDDTAAAPPSSGGGGGGGSSSPELLFVLTLLFALSIRTNRSRHSSITR